MNLLAHLVVALRGLEFLDVGRRQLRPISFDRQLVELGRQGERRLVVRVIHAGQGVGADVEALVPLQNHRQGFFHRLGDDGLTVQLQRAGAGATNAGEIVESQRARAQAVVLELELDEVPAGCERVRAFPLDALEVDQSHTGLPLSR